MANPALQMIANPMFGSEVLQVALNPVLSLAFNVMPTPNLLASATQLLVMANKETL